MTFTLCHGKSWFEIGKYFQDNRKPKGNHKQQKMTRYFGRIDHDLLRTFSHHLLWNPMNLADFSVPFSPRYPAESDSLNGLVVGPFFRPGMICRWSALLSFFLPGLQIMTYRGSDRKAWRKRMFLSHTLRGTVPRILMVRWSPSSPQLWLILSVLTLKRLQAHFVRLTRIIVERLGNDRPSDRRDWLWHALPAQLPDVPTGSEQMERICVGESLAVSVTFCSKKVPMASWGGPKQENLQEPWVNSLVHREPRSKLLHSGTIDVLPRRWLHQV